MKARRALKQEGERVGGSQCEFKPGMTQSQFQNVKVWHTYPFCNDVGGWGRGAAEQRGKERMMEREREVDRLIRV